MSTAQPQFTFTKSDNQWRAQVEPDGPTGSGETLNDTLDELGDADLDETTAAALDALSDAEISRIAATVDALDHIQTNQITVTVEALENIRIDQITTTVDALNNVQTERITSALNAFDNIQVDQITTAVDALNNQTEQLSTVFNAVKTLDDSQISQIARIFNALDDAGDDKNGEKEEIDPDAPLFAGEPFIDADLGDETIDDALYGPIEANDESETDGNA